MKLPVQLHVKLASGDAKKLVKLSRQAKLTVSEVVRAMIRTTSTVATSTAQKV